jgi:hypothetical protein
VADIATFSIVAFGGIQNKKLQLTQTKCLYDGLKLNGGLFAVLIERI